MKKTQHLGKALTLLLEVEKEDAVIGNDLADFYAPIECYALAYAGRPRRYRMARRRALHAAGVRNMRLLRAAIRKRLGNDAWVYRHYGVVPY